MALKQLNPRSAYRQFSAICKQRRKWAACRERLVAQICNRCIAELYSASDFITAEPGIVEWPADYKSAIQQITNLRYDRSGPE